MTAGLELEGRVATVVIDHPPINVIDQPTRTALHAVLDELERLHAADRVRAVVLAGAGEKAFSAGADMREEAGLTPETVRRFLEEDNGVYDRFEALPVPSVAAIGGYCMGGGLELALACDLRVVAPEARLCAAGVKVGLVVSTTRLLGLLGRAAAADLVLTGRTVDGVEAHRLGLATRLAEGGQAGARALAREVAEEIATRAPLALARAKVALGEAASLPPAEAMARELDHFVALSDTRDHKHALESFFSRTPPEFDGT